MYHVDLPLLPSDLPLWLTTYQDSNFKAFSGTGRTSGKSPSVRSPPRNWGKDLGSKPVCWINPWQTPHVESIPGKWQIEHKKWKECDLDKYTFGPSFSHCLLFVRLMYDLYQFSCTLWSKASVCFFRSCMSVSSTKWTQAYHNKHIFDFMWIWVLFDCFEFSLSHCCSGS